MKTIYILLLLIPTLAFSQSNANTIPPGAKVYVEPNAGFETYLIAAIQKKKVDLAVVTDKAQAEFVVSSTISKGNEPGAAAVIFLGKRNANQDASVSIVNRGTGVVVFAYSVHKYDAVKGQQSAAEAIAKNIKNKIKSGK